MTRPFLTSRPRPGHRGPVAMVGGEWLGSVPRALAAPASGAQVGRDLGAVPGARDICCWSDDRYWLGTVVVVRLTEFRGLMQAQFGPSRAPSVARDHVFSSLEGRTADEALAAGADPKAVWFAVCDAYDIPEALRYGLPD
jgi:hypothetical protein